MTIRPEWMQDIEPKTSADVRRRPVEKRARDARHVSPLRDVEARASYKDGVDRVLAALGLIVLAPLLALMCLLVKATSRGPAFHRQDRVGKRGRVFRIIKLRTMVQDAEAATGPVWASANDPRVTAVGRVLRKTHLDEVPQLWNVLLGEMSLVGPRPERPVFVDQFKQLIPNYEERLRVKPGITGLAQIHHRYDATLHDVQTKLAYDLLYLTQMSLLTDLKIVLLTARCLTGGQAEWPHDAPAHLSDEAGPSVTPQAS
jgi:lipopolysaccharide/colanic/teichoic acid biosynthesis glycosyltransferase